MTNHFACCQLCPRLCGVNRSAGEKGYCRVDDQLMVARAALHFWEEPCISGERGSGAVFFSGCNLGCRFCQNRVIARGESGLVINEDRLVEIFFALQGQGAHNINLVTAVHMVPKVAGALQKAKEQGLSIPIVYNSSGYECVQTLQMLDGLVDIYLPDLKYMDDTLALTYSRAENYPAIAQAAIAEMYRQVGDPQFDEAGMMQSGVIVRHLLLPGQVKNAKAVVRYLHETYGNHIYISMMNQYTPTEAVQGDKLLGRKVTKREYERLIDYALDIGVENGFMQEGDTAKESFIPAFDGEGVRR